MNKVLNIYKPLGLTPLQAIQKYKEINSEYKDISMTYAGRLDPMAEGVLLVVCAEEIQNKKQYMNLKKEYIAEILFGASTDTYDILGIPALADSEQLPTQQIENALSKFQGEIDQELPLYSSPLIKKALSGENPEELPTKIVRINQIGLLSNQNISAQTFLEGIETKIALVNGEFRQEQILNSWKGLLDDQNFKVIKIKISCSSGTYVRSLANNIGKEPKTKALLYSLKRTKVGQFNIEDSIKII